MAPLSIENQQESHPEQKAEVKIIRTLPFGIRIEERRTEFNIQGDLTLDTDPKGETYNPLVVNIPAYQGPFDLLLDLIKKNEMDIYNIEISVITEEYLGYLKQMKQYDLEIAGEFLVMAATLMYIKSKMLLPTPEEDEVEDGADPRTELVQKLLEYQAFREAAKELGAMENERAKVFTRQITSHYLSALSSEDSHIDQFGANLYDLLNAFRAVIKDLSKEKIHEVFEEEITIEERIEELRVLLSEKKEFFFRELFLKKNVTKNDIIVTFLALLELIRSKFVCAKQEKQFGEILIALAFPK
jgi:segregation and condensation protein A